MKKTRLSAIVAAATLMTWQAAQASDGQITFEGEITAQTCVVESSGGGRDFTVVLPTVSASALENAADTAGDTPFSIILHQCTPDSGPVRTYFEAGTTVNVEGRLQQQTGTATNVDIQLLNGDGSVIMIGDPITSQNSKPAAIASGSATLPYIGRYYSTGSTTVGTVSSYVMYTLAYE